MKNDDIINKLMNDNIIDNIQADIDAELEKSEPDYDKIAELSELICDISGECLSEIEISKNIAEISEKYNEYEKRRKIKVLYQWISAFSACIVFILALNAYTMVSFGENLFKAVVEMTQSGFSIDFSGDNGNPEETVPAIQTKPVSSATTAVYETIPPFTTAVPLTTAPAAISPGSPDTTKIYTPVTTGTFQTEVQTASTVQTEASAQTTAAAAQTESTAPAAAATTPAGITENIGYTINEKCQKIGIIPCCFNYDTDMQLKEFNYEYNELSADCYFTFINSDRQLDVIIEQYGNAKNIPPVLIPSNNEGYYLISCNIGDVYLFEENTHITAVFVYNNAVYTIIGYNSEFSDMEEIIMSCSPTEQN